MHGLGDNVFAGSASPSSNTLEVEEAAAWAVFKVSAKRWFFTTISLKYMVAPPPMELRTRRLMRCLSRITITTPPFKALILLKGLQVMLHGMLSFFTSKSKFSSVMVRPG
jgi:hypothetical protein